MGADGCNCFIGMKLPLKSALSPYPSAEEGAPGLRRIRQQAHVVFYRAERGGVLIVRVLHHSMDFERGF